MKKTTSLIVWVVALAALLIAAYTFYGKYKTQSFVEPPAPNLQQGETTADQPKTATAPQETTTEPQETVTDKQEAEQSEESQHEAEQSAQTDKIMAPDFTLKDPDGNAVTLSDYEGKIVILNFWAEWCRYCVEEMPDFVKLDKELKESGDAVILAVNVQDSHKVVRDFIADNNLDLKVLMDEDGAIASTYGVSGYPTTFFINPDGSLYTYIPGKTDLETLHIVLDMIRNGKPLR